MVLKFCPETSVTNYQSKLRNIPEERISHLHCGGSLKSCKIKINKVKNVKCSRYRSGVAQRVGRGIDLLFHDRGTRRG